MTMAGLRNVDYVFKEENKNIFVKENAPKVMFSKPLVQSLRKVVTPQIWTCFFESKRKYDRLGRYLSILEGLLIMAMRQDQVMEVAGKD